MHQPVQVFGRSIHLKSFPYLWGSSQLRWEPIIIAHLLCNFTALVFTILLCVQSASITYCTHSPVRCCKTFVVYNQNQTQICQIWVGAWTSLEWENVLAVIATWLGAQQKLMHYLTWVQWKHTNLFGGTVKNNALTFALSIWYPLSLVFVWSNWSPFHLVKILQSLRRFQRIV